MVLSRTGYKVGIAVLYLALTAPVSAAEPTLSPLVLNGRYKIAWSGITLGRINIIAKEDTTSYYFSVDTKTRGMGALISDEAQFASAEGTKSAEDTYIPAKYTSRPLKKDDPDIVTLTYDANGDIVNRLRTKDDDPAWRAPVTFAKVNTARDPITASLILRRELYASLTNGAKEVDTRTYDGMRLAQMKMIRAADAKVEVMGEYKDTICVGIVRNPIEGYTPKELKKFKKGDPDIRLYFSKDAAFLPVRASAKTAIGELSLTLIEMKTE
ncbi:MAG: DUF3108 domain-containing protein [Rickettsiales bacterium]